MATDCIVAIKSPARRVLSLEYYRSATRKNWERPMKSRSLLPGFATLALPRAAPTPVVSMFVRTCFCVAAMTLLAISDARAATYNYVGNPLDYLPGGGWGNLTATVDLNCSGPCAAGTYVEGSGLTSFTLSHQSVLGNFSVGTSSPNYSNSGHINYVTVSDSGHISAWHLFAFTVTFPPSGYQASTQNELGGTRDTSGVLFQFGATNVGTPGSWNGIGTEPINPVPLPPALLLFVGGLGLLGLLGSRSSAKRSRAELDHAGLQTS